MGEIAEMMLEGTLCQQCGEFMGDACGYPRTCQGCKREDRKLTTAPKVSCPGPDRPFARRSQSMNLREHRQKVGI